MSLYNKYRPETLQDMVGDFSGLVRKLNNPEMNHVMLFSGPRSAGKTTTARAVAKFLGAEDFMYEELNFGDDGGIDTIRRLIASSRDSIWGSSRVRVIDEAHAITSAAATAALKLWEDVGPKDYYILCTSEPQKLLPTIRSRAAETIFKPHSDETLVTIMTRVLDGEIPKERPGKEYLQDIAERSLGDARVAINTLEDIISTTADKWDKVIKAMAPEATDADTKDLCIELCKKKPNENIVVEILQDMKKVKADSEGVRRAVLGWMAWAVLDQEAPHIIPRMKLFLAPTYDSKFPGLVYAAMEACQL